MSPKILIVILLTILVNFGECYYKRTNEELNEALEKIDNHITKLNNVIEDMKTDNQDIVCTTEENSQEITVFLRYIMNYLKGSNKQSLIHQIKSKIIQYESNWKFLKKPSQFLKTESIKTSLDIIKELQTFIVKRLSEHPYKNLYKNHRGNILKIIINKF